MGSENVDFSAIHRQLLSDTQSAFVEDRVEVNQRHLIDKILARYEHFLN